MGGDGIAEARAYLATLFPVGDGRRASSARRPRARPPSSTASPSPGRRCATAPCIRRSVEDIVALDIALRRNDRDWLERLPPEIEAQIEKKLYYGHFFCHVFHQDYVVKKGHDCLALEHAMWKLLDARGAEYPAEHNVGHLYHAKPALAGFYRDARPHQQPEPRHRPHPEMRPLARSGDFPCSITP